jgi:thiamine pyrophosphate-dependent acetolactate synthase large subunit-like protein
MGRVAEADRAREPGAGGWCLARAVGVEYTHQAHYAMCVRGDSSFLAWVWEDCFSEPDC